MVLWGWDEKAYVMRWPVSRSERRYGRNRRELRYLRRCWAKKLHLGQNEGCTQERWEIDRSCAACMVRGKKAQYLKLTSEEVHENARMLLAGLISNLLLTANHVWCGAQAAAYRAMRLWPCAVCHRPCQWGLGLLASDEQCVFWTPEKCRGRSKVRSCPGNAPPRCRDEPRLWTTLKV